MPVPTRLRAARRDICISAIAAALAWLIAARGLGHEAPVFAAICALVSLAPGLPNHGKQAVGLIIGMTIGIVVGEGAYLLNPLVQNEWIWLVQLIIAVIIAMLAAAALGWSPVMAIQAGVSVILVMAVGPQSAGLHRLIDGGIGVLIGLICSQFLLTPDPIRDLRFALQAFLNRLAVGLETSADAAERADIARAAAAERQIAEAWSDLRLLHDSVDKARSQARWSLRGRLMATPLLKIIVRQNRNSVHLFAHVLMLSESLYAALRSGTPAPAALVERIRLCARHCRTILRPQPEADPTRHPVGGAARPDIALPAPWAEVAEQLDQVELRLQQLVGLHLRADLYIAGHSDATETGGGTHPSTL